MQDHPTGRGEPATRRASAGPMGSEIYQSLLSRILSLEVAPGDRITIDAVAREFGVSQTPIREALHRLESEGVVVRTHLAGYRVAAPMGRDEFEQLVEMRLLLEPAVANRAAERATPQVVAAMRALNEHMAEGAAGGAGSAYALFARLDAELHDEIAAASGNQVIRTALARLHTHVRLFRLSYNVEITSQALVEHDAVLRAIGVGDGSGAAEAMRRHITASSERFRRSFTGATGGRGARAGHPAARAGGRPA